MLAAVAAPKAPYLGIRTRSSAIPSVSEMTGPTEDSVGAEEASNAFEKTELAANPNALGSNRRNGVTESRYGSPKTTGSSSGPTLAAAATGAKATRMTTREKGR